MINATKVIAESTKKIILTADNNQSYFNRLLKENKSFIYPISKKPKE